MLLRLFLFRLAFSLWCSSGWGLSLSGSSPTRAASASSSSSVALRNGPRPRSFWTFSSSFRFLCSSVGVRVNFPCSSSDSVGCAGLGNGPCFLPLFRGSRSSFGKRHLSFPGQPVSFLSSQEIVPRKEFLCCISCEEVRVEFFHSIPNFAPRACRATLSRLPSAHLKVSSLRRFSMITPAFSQMDSLVKPLI